MEDDKERRVDPVPPHDPPDPGSDGAEGERAGDDSGDAGASGRFMRFTRRLLDRRELTDDAKVLLSAVLDTSDRAKTEMVRMAAREVRTYLNELKVAEGLMELVTSHSLEVKASLHLKPLAPERPARGPAQGGGDEDPDEGR